MSEPASERTQESAGTARGKGSALLGAVFLMATAAIGPGFITQTTEFTSQLGAAFALAIVISVVVDVAIQLNVWRVIGVSGRRAQDLGNAVVPGLGWVLAALVVLGGLVFNIGNVSGAGLGTRAMLGLDPRIGGAISAAIALVLFLVKRAGKVIDWVVLVLGVVMIGLTAYVAVTSDPPVLDAARNVVKPEQIGFFATVTIIGGTVGGYITYAGAHRMIDSGITGPDRVGAVTRGSISAVIVTGIMRVLLFLAILGVVAGGAKLASENPTASAFGHAVGSFGSHLFGIVLWAASITSIIAASYTSVSFLAGRHGMSDRWRTILVAVFIVVTGLTFVLAGAPPVTLLVFAGAFNGLILPIGVGILLWVALRRRDLLRGYRYPVWLFVVGVLAWLLTIYLAVKSFGGLVDLL